MVWVLALIITQGRLHGVVGRISTIPFNSILFHCKHNCRGVGSSAVYFYFIVKNKMQGCH
jgi:hypothetical protein